MYVEGSTRRQAVACGREHDSHSRQRSRASHTPSSSPLLRERADLGGRIAPAPDTGEILEVREVDDCAIQIINHCFHYIGTPRSAFVGLGLYRRTSPFCNDLPLTLVALSEFDLENVSAVFPFLNIDSTVVVSRVYSFPWSQANSVSAVLKHARQIGRAHV